MKKLILLVSCLCMASVATGKVSTRVCLFDGNTLFLPVDINLPIIEYPDIMVGTRLTIIVGSNVAEDWSGYLIIEDDHRNYGVLSARGPLIFGDWSGSHLEAAGDYALVNYREEPSEPNNDGFSLYTDWDIDAGDWFIIDYNATNIGDCNVGFYEYAPPFSDDNDILINYLGFTHVRTRDFNHDTNVDSADFAVLALYWGLTNCDELNWCDGVDLNTDRIVDFIDVMLFTDYWLEKTDKRCHN